MALSMIEGAERRGELRPGGKVVEYTGGSTGSSLAMVCAINGYRAHFVSSDGFAEEKIQTMRAFGATVEIIHAEGGILTAKVIDDMIARAKELKNEPLIYPTIPPAHSPPDPGSETCGHREKKKFLSKFSRRPRRSWL